MKNYCCPPDVLANVITVQQPNDLKQYANCFVYVYTINTTYYVSAKHEVVQIYAGPVFEPNYDYAANPLNLREQICYDFANNIAIIYNNAGDYRIINLTEGAN